MNPSKTQTKSDLKTQQQAHCKASAIWSGTVAMITFVAAMTMIGCSSSTEGTTENNEGQRVESPRKQALKTTPVGTQKPPVNVVSAYDIQDNTRRYTFDFRPAVNSKIYMSDEVLASVNCPNTAYAKFTLVSSDGRIQSNQRPGEPFAIAEANTNYQFAVDLSNLKGCASIYVSFVIKSEVVQDHFVGSESLSITNYNAISTVRGQTVVYKNLTFKSTRDQNLYFQSVASSFTDDCGANKTYELEWQELDAKGAVVSRTRLTDASDFRAKASTDYILRVSIKTQASCSYGALTITARSW